jgi:hypothetical protein
MTSELAALAPVKLVPTAMTTEMTRPVTIVPEILSSGFIIVYPFFKIDNLKIFSLSYIATLRV